MRQRDNLRVSRGQVAWLEYDPAESANQLWCLRNGAPLQVTAPDFSIRSGINGYGGGALCLDGPRAFVVESADQQIQQVDCNTGARSRLTCEPDARFGGLVWDPVRCRILAVCERLKHGQVEAQQLVAIDPETGRVGVLASGEDFYGAPVLSQNGCQLSWVTWSLPDMPWLFSRLWRAQVNQGGTLASPCPMDTPRPASVQQPLFVEDRLVALSDHQGWWQPYDVSAEADSIQWQALTNRQADHANAPWQLQESHSVALPGKAWARVIYHQGTAELWLCDGSGEHRLAERFVDFRALQQKAGRILCIGKRPDALDSVLDIDPATGAVTLLAGGEQPLGAGGCVSPELLRFTAANGMGITGFFYRPVRHDPGHDNGLTSPDLPPVIIRVHGGPSSAAYPVFDPQVQFWVQHGLAVLDVNYRGSTGFGREFRLALAGNWGEADVEDMCAAVAYLKGHGLADHRRAFIQGRSAGGFTVLMAMMETGVFKAGASLFGVSDPARLRSQTHRFESGYLDWLLGDPDQHRDRWQQRTPVLQAHRITAPVIFYQGGQDQVVVPAQTDTMVAALKASGQAPAYHYFPEEGHGFRSASRQAFLLASLLRFYQDHC